jgi:hypothetical protein
MRRLEQSWRIGAAAIAIVITVGACTRDSLGPAATDLEPQFAKPAPNPSVPAKWLLPMDGQGIGFFGDGIVEEAGFSLYRNGDACVESVVYVGASSSQDGTLSTTKKGCRPSRTVTIRYVAVDDPEDVRTETGTVFANVRDLSTVEAGEMGLLTFVINVTNSFCGAYRFIDVGLQSPYEPVGADRVEVSAATVNGKTRWHVRTQPSPANRFECHATGQYFFMDLDFYIEVL